PLISGFIKITSTKDVKDEILDIERTLGFFIAVILGIYIARKFILFKEYSVFGKYIPNVIEVFFEDNPLVSVFLVSITLIIILQILLSIIIKIINSVTIDPLLKTIYNFGQKSSTFGKRVLGSILQIPKSIIYVILTSIILNFGAMAYKGTEFNNYLEKSKLYTYISNKVIVPIYNSSFAQNLPIILSNTLQVEEIKESSNLKRIVYYNGITLESGIKSNKEINDFAKEITSKYTKDRDKAKALYAWVGENIDYDYDKADRIMMNDYSKPSGAISTFNSREGICFDYACLYVAMARAVGLKVRLVTGEGFNGTSWVNHAWNQVYIKESGEWINVDPTFFKSGNYFDSKRFSVDHKGDKIVGEW
ncbi:transglutaminase family protein, partial [Clostridium sp.]|uniref:transglutaminase family protein n=1 Tax=Clostridium sp. TaxID=1506 RepID=UPI0034641D9A